MTQVTPESAKVVISSSASSVGDLQVTPTKATGPLTVTMPSSSLSLPRVGSITKDFRFSAGHTLALHRGKCRNLHGHNYTLRVSIKGPIHNDGTSSNDMVMDFGDLKDVMRPLIEYVDHRFIIWEHDPRYIGLMAIDPTSLIALPFHPTAERLAIWFENRIEGALGDQAVDVSITLWETDDSSAST